MKRSGIIEARRDKVSPKVRLRTYFNLLPVIIFWNRKNDMQTEIFEKYSHELNSI